MAIVSNIVNVRLVFGFEHVHAVLKQHCGTLHIFGSIGGVIFI